LEIIQKKLINVKEIVMEKTPLQVPCSYKAGDDGL
jgi:hypothetical protein